MARSDRELTPRGRQWAVLVEQWEGSGTTMREFCARHGVQHSTFAWWRHELSRRKRKNTGTIELVEIAVPGSGASERVIEVVLSNGIRLRVPAGFERRALEELLAVVRGC
jgi:transposase-like protein